MGGQNKKLIRKGCLSSDTTCGQLKTDQKEKVSEAEIEFHDCKLVFYFLIDMILVASGSPDPSFSI